MTASSTIVAVVFGLLMGWSLTGGHYERRPVLVALAGGMIVGALMLGFSYGPDPVVAGSSLLVGCASAMTVLVVRRPNEG